MIHFDGPDWASKRRVEELVRERDTTPAEQHLFVCWGEGNVELEELRDVGEFRVLNAERKLDAVEQLEAFRGAGVVCPDYTRSLEEARQWICNGSLVFGRKRTHSQGRDIFGPTHPRWDRREYWTRVVPDIAEEWRVHVFLGRSIARGLKFQAEPPHRKLPIRNRDNGWRMRHDIPTPVAVREVAKRAVEAVEYDFGAVDVLVTKDGEVYVLEVNRAPGCDESTAIRYAEAIVKWAMNNR